MKTKFEIKQFILDKRLTPQILALKLSVHPDTIYKIIRRGIITLSFLNKLETQFGDCSKYILTNETKGKEVA